VLSKSVLPVALLLSLAVPVEGATIRWKFKEGDVFYNQADVSIRQTITVMGRKVNQKSDQTTVTRFTVKKVNADKSVVLEQEIVDTTVQGDIVPGDAAKKLKGTKFTITLSARGKLEKFEGYDDFLDKLSGGNDEQRKVLAAMMPEDTFKTVISETFGFTPGKEVEKGDSWKLDYKVSMGPLGDLSGGSTYRYEGKEKKGEKIGFKATLKYAPPGNAGAGLPFTIDKGTLKAEDFNGVIYFDAEKGRVAESSMSAKITGTLTISVMGNKADMDMEQNLQMRSRITDKAPAIKDD
jgi:hypothetical protein